MDRRFDTRLRDMLAQAEVFPRTDRGFAVASGDLRSPVYGVTAGARAAPTHA